MNEITELSRVLDTEIEERETTRTLEKTQTARIQILRRKIASIKRQEGSAPLHPNTVLVMQNSRLRSLLAVADKEGKTFKELGSHLMCSAERARQIYSKGLRRLRYEVYKEAQASRDEQVKHCPGET